jgi:PTH2 family peptidyl-tRNA hydrolase
VYKQIIIARKDLGMSPGKLAAQVSHASMAFLTWLVRDNAKLVHKYHGDIKEFTPDYYTTTFFVDREMYEQWMNGTFTKVVLQAKTRAHLMKAIDMAKELGMVEGTDYFVIRDACRTELEPEDDGTTVTCVGFKPMLEEVIDQIGKKFHMYME